MLKFVEENKPPAAVVAGAGLVVAGIKTGPVELDLVAAEPNNGDVKSPAKVVFFAAMEELVLETEGDIDGSTVVPGDSKVFITLGREVEADPLEGDQVVGVFCEARVA